MNVERRLLSLVAWPLHRGLLRLTGRRVGLTEPRSDRVGMLLLTTVGRRSGRTRETPLFFLRDGANHVVVPSNAGLDSDPAWWLNLQAQPEARIRTPAGESHVTAREATSQERDRLWPELVRGYSGFDRYRRRRTTRIPIVILEPR